jgi:hypothetical protein
MKGQQSYYGWSVDNWAGTTLPGAALLLLLAPFISRGVSPAVFLVFLLLPLYMIHQYEEHGHGKFKKFVNEVVGKGKQVLDDEAIFWINILGVWCLSLLGLYLSVYVSAAYGLAIGYLTLVNGISHVLMTIVKRRLNPGFWTSLLLFIPVGTWTIYSLSVEANDGIVPHVLGLAVALAVHAVILIFVRGRLKTMSAKKAATPAGKKGTATRPARS